MVAPQSSVKRIRGVAVSRPIIVGTTATPLSPAEKLVSPPDHTHRWTVALRSAASHPIAEAPRPTVLNPGGGVGMEATGGAAGSSATVGAAAGIRPRNHFSTPSLSALNTTPGTPGHTGVSTRGRESELDFHRMVGGKDDISYFVRRVQFKLHETYAQPTRNVDKSPFQITETGWGEFEIQIKIFFVPEANEKPITLYHHLKLHPWSQGTDVVWDNPIPADPIGILRSTHPDDVKREGSTAPSGSSAVNSAVHPGMIQPLSTDSVLPPLPVVAVPVVHSWQYEEIVFPEPTEPFYEILLAHPPTPLPATSEEAFANPAAYKAYEEQKRRYTDWLQTQANEKRPAQVQMQAQAQTQLPPSAQQDASHTNAEVDVSTSDPAQGLSAHEQISDATQDAGSHSATGPRKVKSEPLFVTNDLPLSVTPLEHEKRSDTTSAVTASNFAPGAVDVATGNAPSGMPADKPASPKQSQTQEVPQEKGTPDQLVEGSSVEPSKASDALNEGQTGPPSGERDGSTDLTPPTEPNAGPQPPTGTETAPDHEEGIPAAVPASPEFPQHPHPVHSVSGQLIEALSHGSILGEGKRLDQARIAIVAEIDRGRAELIAREKEIRRLKVLLAQQQSHDS